MNFNDDPHPAYIALCVQYDELEQQQRNHPSQWGDIEKEKAMIREKLTTDFKDCQFAQFNDDAFLRQHYQPAESMPQWVMFCIFVGVVFGITALSLHYFDALVM